MKPGFHSSERLVEGARALVTVGPEHPIWQVSEAEGAVYVEHGSFVRIEPPPEALDELVEQVRKNCAQRAASVRVLPRRRAAVIVESRENRPHVRARDVVLAMVEEANVGEDRAALLAFCEELLARRGL